MCVICLWSVREGIWVWDSSMRRMGCTSTGALLTSHRTKKKRTWVAEVFKKFISEKETILCAYYVELFPPREVFFLSHFSFLKAISQRMMPVSFFDPDWHACNKQSYSMHQSCRPATL